MSLGQFAFVLCMWAAIVVGHEPEGKDVVEDIRHLLRVINYNSHLPKVAMRHDMPHFHALNFHSIQDNDRPCGDRWEERYRRPDGYCNNLRHPFQGGTMDTERRLFSNYYQDGRSFPRVQNKDFQNLPSARVVSLKCFGKEEDDDGPGSKLASQQVWIFGQLLAHDMTLLERFTNSTYCCDRFSRDHPFDALYHGDGLCFPIEVPPDDPYFKEDCMTFKRTFGVDVYGVREGVNGITSYVDGSIVYGATMAQTKRLRLGVQGLLDFSKLYGEDQLPEWDDYPCVKSKELPHCHGSGDSRLADHPGLISIHTMFHVEHNRVAKRLYRLNKHWDDERLFQEARKVVGGVIQKILYEEYLPLLLGNDVMRIFRLDAPYVYDDGVDGGAVLEFTTTAHRYGHSMINTKIEDQEIAELYFRPTTAKRTHTVPFYMAHHRALKSDNRFSDQVRLRMYEGLRMESLNPLPGPSFDLPALNIQRGRDLGVPPFSVVRDFCLNLLHGVHGAHNYTPPCLKKGVYRNEEDIDLFVGGISEPQLPNAVLGPTFACLTAIQFQRVKFGDRFFYETDGPEGFTPEQLRFVKQNSLSSVICEMNPDEVIQRDAFRPVSDSNPLIPCSTIQAERDANGEMGHWRETTVRDYVHPLFTDVTSCRKWRPDHGILKILH